MSSSSRRPSAGTGGGRKSRAGATARAARNRDTREGRSTVPCPACGTEYRIPVEMLEDQITCKSCGRLFVPKNASRRRIRDRNPAQPFILGGAALLFMVIGFFIVSAGQKPVETGTTATVRKVETGERNPRVRDVQEWVTALSTGNSFKLMSASDLAALASLLGVESAGRTSAERDELVVKALLEGEKTAFLRDAHPTSGEIDEADAEAPKGRVRVFLGIDPEASERYVEQAGQYEFTFDFREGRARVTGFAPLIEPKLRPPPREKGPRAVRHDIIGAAETVKRDMGQGETEVREAELKPLPHLEGTSEQLQREIDDHIAKLIDVDAPGAVSNRAALALRRIGKPAMPRLLNQLYELVTGAGGALDDRTTLLRLRRVTMALEDLTGLRFGFDPSAIDGVATITQQSRMSALKQWYGYWADNHWREDWALGIDRDEDPLGREADKAKPKPADGDRGGAGTRR